MPIILSKHYVGVNLDEAQRKGIPILTDLAPSVKDVENAEDVWSGCRENAKNTLDRNYLWFAEKLGLEILPETKVEKISFSDGRYTIETKRITSLFSQKKRVFKSKGIIVAAGALGTLDLLLKQKYKYKTLPPSLRFPWSRTQNKCRNPLCRFRCKGENE